MKPIEPGCLAVIIAGEGADIENVGKVVTVVEWVSADGHSLYLGGSRYTNDSPGWVCEGSGLVVGTGCGQVYRNLSTTVLEERQLMRIDGDDEQSTRVQEKELCHG